MTEGTLLPPPTSAVMNDGAQECMQDALSFQFTPEEPSARQIPFESPLTLRDLDFERAWWAEAMGELFRQLLNEHTRKLQSCVVEEAQKQTQQLQDSLAAGAQKGAAEALRLWDERGQPLKLPCEQLPPQPLTPSCASEAEEPLEQDMRKTYMDEVGPHKMVNQQVTTIHHLTRDTDADACVPTCSEMEVVDHRAKASLNFQGLVEEASSRKRDFGSALAHKSSKKALGKARHFVHSVRPKQEPPRSGCLYTIITSVAFELVVSFTVLANCCVMVYEANVGIDSSSEYSPLSVADWCFQTVYTVEVASKLIVHRQCFFWCDNYKAHSFDLLVVIAGFFTLSSATFPGGLSIVHVLNVGKAARVIRVLGHFRFMRALIECLSGSMLSLFWSLVMLGFVYFVFALVFLSFIRSHMEETGEVLEESLFFEPFGSTEKTMLTLYKASTGGDDWSAIYDVIRLTGSVASAAFLFFIGFVQIAVLNILTGLFVDSAMAVLKPDTMMHGLSQLRKDHSDTLELESICRTLDNDDDGLLTLEEFQMGMQTDALSSLLKGLDTRRHNIEELFRISLPNGSDDGRVDIKQFASDCLLLKGTATCFDMMMLRAEVHTLHDTLVQCFKLKL